MAVLVGNDYVKSCWEGGEHYILTKSIIFNIWWDYCLNESYLFLWSRCADAGVKYLESKVEKIVEENERGSVVLCENGMLLSCRYAWVSIYFPICLFPFWNLPLIWICISSRLVTAASGAASGRFLNYEGGGPEICVQTAYGIEVNVSFCSSLWWKERCI